MAATQISWVLAAHDPESLSCFYGSLLGQTPRLGLSIHHWLVAIAEGIDLQIYRPSSKRPFPTRGRALALCLRRQASPDPLPSLEQDLKQALSFGATVIDPPRVEFFGAEVWITDPEGNAVLLMVPASREGVQA